MDDENKKRRPLGKGLSNLFGSTCTLKRKEITRPNLWQSGEEERKDIFNTIEEYIVVRYGKSVQSIYNNNIFFYEQNNLIDLMIRYSPYGYHEFINCIVIARISFKNTREGNGTHFLSFLCEISKKFGISHIVIESVNSNSRAFAKSLGFTNSRTEDVLAVEVLILENKISINC